MIYQYAEEVTIIDSAAAERFLFSGSVVVTLYRISKGHPGRFSGPPEDCFPAEPPEWAVDNVELDVNGKRIQLTTYFYGYDGLIERAEDAANNSKENDYDL